jgi:exodeoxyribonuclease V beta subunit
VTGEVFDICGPVPTGITVLEASAGTGKTFTIAALATRYVAEGLAPLGRLMLVTFGRAATAELRERVRDRLLTAERGLADPAAARAGEDELLRMLASTTDHEVTQRRRRLTTALATFDGATIATTHGFCQQMLAGLGVAGDADPDAAFTESIDDLVTEVVDDLYIRKYGTADAGRPEMSYACAVAVARSAMGDRQARLEPADAPDGSPAAARYGLARAVRTEVEARKRRQRLLDFDDLLTRLRDALTDAERGGEAARRVRSRYDVVLVDEFQDTDPVQWDILRLAFAGSTTLILVGDPKQAIYAFRGADVCAYLDAAATATTRQTLARNWRSDAPLVTALDALFGGAALGDPRIVVRPVSAAHSGRRLLGAPANAPLRLRVLPRSPGATGLPRVDPVRQRVAGDLAADVVRLLASPAHLHGPDGSRPVRPADLAVLVRTNLQGALVRDALRQAGVPVVLSGASSVFGTDAAREWLVLLQALEQPHRAGRVRAAGLTCFFGWTAERLANGADEALNVLGTQVRQWADVLAARGVAALAERITVSQRLPARLLATVGGERVMTDLRHLGQSLHGAAVTDNLGLTALAEWLQQRIADADTDTSEARSRRLESDAEAVQVVTVHRSKGLEFPIVYVPFGWDRYVPPTPDPLQLHDADGIRVLDVGGTAGPGYAERRTRHQSEESGEDLRLFYVAVTRAQCQVITWWAPSTTTAESAAHRLLFRPTDHQAILAPVTVPGDDEAARVLAELAQRAGGTIAVEKVEQVASASFTPASSPGPVLAAATFDRYVDIAWRRTSYSALTAAVHDGTAATAAGLAAGVGSEPEVAGLADEPGPESASPIVATPEAAGDEQRLRAVPSPMADLPAGTEFGTAVHSVLESIDPGASDPAAELLARCAEVIAGRLVANLDAGALAAGLLPVLATPLGPLAGGRRLLDIPRADRLAELDFELPLLGGDAPVGRASLAAVADLLRRHLPAADPLARYPDLLDRPGLSGQQLRGYLSGSVDAVLRLPDEAGEPRYVVVDYKTNWLGDGGPGGSEPLTAWHYRPAALAESMLAAHYPLQALLYAVALHRYLRWRQPEYDPARHLGGVLYLYVRGMCGPDTPVVAGAPCGVFGWQPPTGLVADVSRLLGGAR